MNFSNITIEGIKQTEVLYKIGNITLTPQEVVKCEALLSQIYQFNSLKYILIVIILGALFQLSLYLYRKNKLKWLGIALDTSSWVCLVAVLILIAQELLNNNAFISLTKFLTTAIVVLILFILIKNKEKIFKHFKVK